MSSCPKLTSALDKASFVVEQQIFMANGQSAQGVGERNWRICEAARGLRFHQIVIGREHVDAHDMEELLDLDVLVG